MKPRERELPGWFVAGRQPPMHPLEIYPRTRDFLQRGRRAPCSRQVFHEHDDPPGAVVSGLSQPLQAQSWRTSSLTTSSSDLAYDVHTTIGGTASCTLLGITCCALSRHGPPDGPRKETESLSTSKTRTSTKAWIWAVAAAVLAAVAVLVIVLTLPKGPSPSATAQKFLQAVAAQDADAARSLVDETDERVDLALKNPRRTQR